MLERQHAGFLRDIDLYAPGELEQDRVQCEFLRPRGFGREVGATIPMPSGDLLVFSFHYVWAVDAVPQASIDFLDELRPHMARAALLTGRLWVERARTAVQAFQAMGLPAAAIARDGRVLTSNAMFTEEKQIVAAAGNSIGLRDRGARMLYSNALAELRLGEPNIQSILLPAEDDAAATVLHLLPLRGVGRDFSTNGLTLVVLTSMSQQALPAADLLHALFDLTPAEARVARGLTAGHSLPDLAIKHGVSHKTMRSHLKSVLVKTGTNKQTQLLRLLSRMPPEAAPVRRSGVSARV